MKLLPNFQKRGGLTRSQFLEGGCWERGVDHFQGPLQFFHKKKLKFEIFNGKKVYKQKCFNLS